MKNSDKTIEEDKLSEGLVPNLDFTSVRIDFKLGSISGKTAAERLSLSKYIKYRLARHRLSVADSDS